MAAPSPFGKESRIRILKHHFSQEEAVTAASAWKFIYRELLWIDHSTGLAHLYESDKAQPGRPWYGRTVIFTDMICERFGHISRQELKLQLDRLFRACLERIISERGVALEEDELIEALSLLKSPNEIAEEIVQATADDKQAHEADYTPDAELVAEFTALIVRRVNVTQLQAESLARELATRARLHFTVERKRQNVLGEGFEDLLQLLITNVSKVPEDYLLVRQRANKLPGFQNSQTTRERIEAPDIAIVRNNRTELLASVKWSLRHDRQKQLSDELDCYVDLLSQAQFPEYILITNEYDPGRLVNTDGLNRRGQKIDRIYHINLDLLLGCLHDHDRLEDVRALIMDGRLFSIEDLLNHLSRQFGSDEQIPSPTSKV